ncbi:MAG: helix-turn-helix domain-containing protein [Phycisphaerales bacterium]
MSKPTNTQPIGVRLRDAVLDLPLSRMGKAVLSALVRHADHTTGECWPSTSTLASLAGTRRETVSRTIGGELVPSGLVAIVRPGGGSNPNLYRVNLRQLLTRAEQARVARATKRRKPSPSHTDSAALGCSGSAPDAPMGTVECSPVRRECSPSGTCDDESLGAVTPDHSAPRSTITRACDAGSLGGVTGAHTNREGEQGKGNRETEPERTPSPQQQQQRAPRAVRIPAPVTAAAAAERLRFIPADDEPEPDPQDHAARMAELRGAHIAQARAQTLAMMPWNTPERIRRLRDHVRGLGTRIKHPPGLLIQLLTDPCEPQSHTQSALTGLKLPHQHPTMPRPGTRPGRRVAP